MQLIGNRYRIKSLIGEGGMASVYAAIDEKLDRRVAVKVLHAHLARNEDIRQRFHQEAKSISGIDHPNIIKVYDFSGNDSEQLWIVAEILYGVDLSEYVQRFQGNRLHPIIAALMAREICSALEEVHQNGIVHRDIKPENIMVLDSGVIKLMDFGIAKVAASQKATQTGTFMGSPSYMSPEQIKGIKVDVRTDIYSLNVLFYEILTGTLPYVGSNTADVINKIMIGKYTPPHQLIQDLPYEIDQLIVQSLQGDRNKRHPNIVSYGKVLDKFLSEQGIKSSPHALREFFKDPKHFFERVAASRSRRNQSRTTSNRQPRQASSNQGQPTRSQTRTNHQQAAPASRSAQRQKMQTQAPSAIVPPQQGEPFAGHNANDAQRHRQTQRQSAPPDLTRHHPQARPAGNRAQTVRSRSSTKRRSPPVVQVVVPKQKSGGGFWGMLLTACLITGVIFGGLVLKNRRANQKVKRQDITEVAKNNTKKPRLSRLSDNSDDPAFEEDDDRNPNPRLNNRRPKTENKKTSRAAIRTKPSSRPKNVTVQKSTPQGADAEVPPETEAVNNKSPTIEESPNQADPAKLSDPATASIEPNIQPVATGPGRVRITSLPAAEIYINNQMFGTTNDKSVVRKGIVLEPGTYTLTLKRRGYDNMTERVTVSPEQTVNLNFILQKGSKQVTLNVQTNKLPTKVELEALSGDGSKRTINMAKKNSTIELTPGSYRITATHGSERIERMIDLNENTDAITFNARFK
ncbi:serine/threonine-protein kinase [Pseudobacteriovorax antillogorgiicola]|uniref:Serine/threonine protein kinase n=1 Tax=Pseudobacteriovorax antillogorgiicola TaxID=1513793 RepID=A0A1Y6BRL1_9BACT|nr:serine/threonine-protein kinase [Pseudobacteriovorax antillogorgiicola]TCS53817.1 serine/threonine protein kinase [Pseudobacteriovorax antillogorgiicola]SMF21922.1 Serine/threonine protein kinase [Pseudobacteriovorax antillogorgiicola]